MSPPPNKVDYQHTLSCALRKLFPDEDQRKTVAELLTRFSCQPDWKARVGLAVLHLSGTDIDRVRQLLSQHSDPRDTISMAEYPLQSRCWKPRGMDKTEYRNAIDQDLKNYTAWLDEMAS